MSPRSAPSSRSLTVRRAVALFFVLAGCALGAGCGLFAPPELPQVPELPQAPEAPKPPDVKPPEVPQLQSPIPLDAAGNCCFRQSKAAEQCARGSTRCCLDKYERAECEDQGGFWFHETADCVGAC